MLVGGILAQQVKLLSHSKSVHGSVRRPFCVEFACPTFEGVGFPHSHKMLQLVFSIILTL